jgi:hypothetical protein
VDLAVAKVWSHLLKIEGERVVVKEEELLELPLSKELLSFPELLALSPS